MIQYLKYYCDIDFINGIQIVFDHPHKSLNPINKTIKYFALDISNGNPENGAGYIWVSDSLKEVEGLIDRHIDRHKADLTLTTLKGPWKYYKIEYVLKSHIDWDLYRQSINNIIDEEEKRIKDIKSNILK